MRRYAETLAILLHRVPRELAARAMSLAGTVLFSASGRRRRELARRTREREVHGEPWFTPEERAMVGAMATLIVPSDAETPGVSEMEVLGPSAVSVLNGWVLESPGKQAIYARGLIVFDALARHRYGSGFVQLEPERQEALFEYVGSLSPGGSGPSSLPGKLKKKLGVLKRMADGSAAATELLPVIVGDVLGAFYSSQVSWIWLGYDGPPMPEGYADLEHARARRPDHQFGSLRRGNLPSRHPPVVPVPSRTRTPDVVVIGSGAGGAVVAKELGEAGMTVVVLEAGRRFDPKEDYVPDRSDFELADRDTFQPADPLRDLYTTGPRSDGFMYNRVKGVGGSTLKYMAMSPRLHESDFRVRSEDGVAEDWPLSYADLEPFYTRVEYELGISGPDGAAANPFDPPRSHPFPTPPHRFNLASQAILGGARKLGLHMVREPVAIPTREWEGRPACIEAGTCRMGCTIGAKSSMDVTYIPKAEATGRVEILTESTAFRIEIGRDGKARRVLYFDREGCEQAIEAKVIVVACNAVETTRLLLLSTSARFPGGLANSSGMVGLNFMEHLAVYAHGLLPERVDPWRGIPTGGMIQDFYATNPANNFARGWTVIVSSNSHWPVRVASGLPGWGAGHQRRMLAEFGHSVCLTTIGEQLPSPRNRVTLDPTKRDSFGLPVPRLVNEPGENDRQMITAAARSLKAILDAAGAANISGSGLSPGGSSHYLGTCRMGSNPGTSVVDPWGRAHDVPNLFIADGSVLVTGGAVNPALTISALATRTAKGIVNAFKRGEL